MALRKLVNGKYVDVADVGRKGKVGTIAHVDRQKTALTAAVAGADEGKIAPEMKELRAVLRQLNPKDATHWTRDGKPDLNVLKEKLGRKVSRATVEAALPGFVRPEVTA